MAGVCDYALKIDTASDSTAVMSDLKAGIKNVSVALNETVDQSACLGDGGWSSSQVTGGQMIVTLTGKRVVGDTAQDYIFGTMAMDLTKRKRAFEMTDPEGNKYEGDATFAKIGMPSGDANLSGGDISLEIHFNGKPTFTAAT